MARNAGPTLAEQRLIGDWQRQLDRLNEDVVGQLQILRCFDEALACLDEKGSVFVRQFVARMFMHSAAIGVRRVFRKGSDQKNISLERLLVSFRANSVIIVRHGHEPSLREWLALVGGRAVGRDQVESALDSEVARLRSEMNDIREYANTIAHLQKKQLRLRKRRVRAALEDFGRVINACYALLQVPRPDLNEDAFVARFEDEVDRLFSI